MAVPASLNWLSGAVYGTCPGHTGCQNEWMQITPRTAVLTLFAMLAFAGNSLLCRLALKDGQIDAASFTAIRIVSGALVLALLIWRRGAQPLAAGNWRSAWALFAYAAGFSFAYLGLSAATGALLLFGAVQATMMGYGLWRGERFNGWQLFGLALAFAGLLMLLLPGLVTPSLSHGLLMAGAGIAWGVYSLRARGSGDPLRQPRAISCGQRRWRRRPGWRCCRGPHLPGAALCLRWRPAR